MTAADRKLPCPTEGIKYAGSKLKLIPHILRLVRKVPATTILDGFAGTTRVAQALARNGYRVVSNDIAAWSEVFGACYLLNRKAPDDYADLIRHLNSLPPVEGWFTAHYGGRANGGSAVQADGRKRPWQEHNTRKLDAIRDEIDRLALSPVERAVALTSLILALDKVDNTLGHYVSYLREWSRRSYENLVLRVPLIFPNSARHRVCRKDIFRLAPDVTADLAYFDPPYGSNNDKMPPSRVRYASYYHVWTTVCRHDRPDVFGRAGRRTDSSDPAAASVFEDYRKSPAGRLVAVEALDRLIRVVRAPWLILSYSSGGRATAAEVNAVLGAHGRVREVVAVDYRRNVMADMRWTRTWLREAEEPHREFLFLLEKK